MERPQHEKCNRTNICSCSDHLSIVIYRSWSSGSTGLP